MYSVQKKPFGVSDDLGSNVWSLIIGSYDGEDDVVMAIPDEKAVISTDARRKLVELSARPPHLKPI